jgi:glycerophosphoryl diester phosphodiesterase
MLGRSACRSAGTEAPTPTGWPINFAHRGGRKIVPENTIEGFQEAIKLGPVVLELDARVAADGEVVVIHDETVDRTTDGTGEVARMTLAELQRLDAGHRFTPAPARRSPGGARA